MALVEIFQEWLFVKLVWIAIVNVSYASVKQEWKLDRLQDFNLNIYKNGRIFDR